MRVESFTDEDPVNRNKEKKPMERLNKYIRRHTFGQQTYIKKDV